MYDRSLLDQPTQQNNCTELCSRNCLHFTRHRRQGATKKLRLFIEAGYATANSAQKGLAGEFAPGTISKVAARRPFTDRRCGPRQMAKALITLRRRNLNPTFRPQASQPYAFNIKFSQGLVNI